MTLSTVIDSTVLTLRGLAVTISVSCGVSSVFGFVEMFVEARCFQDSHHVFKQVQAIDLLLIAIL